MRRVALYLVLFLVTISAATGVHASTECEKWLTEYKNSLAHSPTAHRVASAHRRLHHYLHRKLALVKKPAAKPHLLPARHTRPRMTREELLRRLQLACGDLPLDIPADGKLTPDPLPNFLAEMSPDDTPVELASGPGAGFLETYAPPTYPGTYSSGSPSYPGFPAAPPFGGGGSGGGKTPPNSPPGGGGDQPPPGGGDTPPTPVPEPESIVLLLTGLSGLAEVVRRRRG